MNALKMLCSPLLLLPAYGHTYATKEAMQAAWDKGVDFKMYGAGYCSIRNIERMSANASSVTIHDPRTRVNLKVG